MGKQLTVEASVPDDDGRDIEVPDVPDFSRMPFRPAEDAEYRDPTDLPPHLAENPLYLALPGPRSMKEVQELISAGTPKPDLSSVLGKPALVRREWIDVVDPLAIPLPRHVQLEDMIMTTIRNSCGLRPWHHLYIEEAAAKANLIGEKTRTGVRGAVGSGSLFGDVGMGKTLVTTKLLLGCPQVIRHKVFRGRRLGIQQVVWLYLSMPPKASAYGLLAWIASTLDYMFGTSYRDDVDSAKNHTAQVRVIARALAVHAVGVIFCDEVQNIRVGSSVERATLENTLQDLINYTHTRWTFIGTRKARGSIESAALLRRMCGERGRIVWDPLEGIDWQVFAAALWQWRVTRDQGPLTPELLALWHRLCGGVPDYAKRLFTLAQANVIGNGMHPNEELNASVMTTSMRASFPDEHRLFELRYKMRMRRESTS